MSGEIMADVDDAYQRLSNRIEASVNEALGSLSLHTEFEEWTFIAIILPPGVLDYREITRRHIKRKVLEFRLRIDHKQFLHATEPERVALIIDALERSIGLMPKLKIKPDDCGVIAGVLANVRGTLISETKGAA